MATGIETRVGFMFNRLGSCALIRWHDDIRLQLKALGLDPDLFCYKTSTELSDNFLRCGYFSLVEISILDGSRQKIDLANYISGFARDEKAAHGDNMGLLLVRQNGRFMIASVPIET